MCDAVIRVSVATVFFSDDLALHICTVLHFTVWNTTLAVHQLISMFGSIWCTTMRNLQFSYSCSTTYFTSVPARLFTIPLENYENYHPSTFRVLWSCSVPLLHFSFCTFTDDYLVYRLPHLLFCGFILVPQLCIPNHHSHVPQRPSTVLSFCLSATQLQLFCAFQPSLNCYCSVLHCNYSVHSNHHSTAHAPQLLSTVLCTLARLLLNFVYYSVLSNPPSLKCTLLSCDYQSTTIQPTVRYTFDHTCWFPINSKQPGNDSSTYGLCYLEFVCVCVFVSVFALCCGLCGVCVCKDLLECCVLVCVGCDCVCRFVLSSYVCSMSLASVDM